MEIAKTILQQLGGNKFIAMTGSKQFVAMENGLKMKLARNGSRANYLYIELNSMDLYNMSFYKLNNKTLNLELVAKHENVYNDMLSDIFTEVTKLYTSL
jgi:hypothetical protein